MAWYILAAAYLLIGLGVFAWDVRGRHMTQKKRSARALALLPELCLFWPLVLFAKIRDKQKADQSTGDPTE